MKKLFFFLLISLSSLWTVVEAKWIVGERKNATQIHAGDTVVLEHSSRTADLGCYLQAVTTAKGVELREGLGIGDAAICVLEEGPADLRTGEPTVYIKLVNNDKYIGQSTSWDNGCGLATDPAKAANFQVISCSEDIPWSNTYGWEDFQEGVFRDDATYTGKTVANWLINNTGRGSDENSVGFAWSKSETDFAYLGFWGTKAPNILLWGYTDTNQWNVYAVTYEKSLQDDLQDVIDTYTGDGKEFTAGTDPGYYDEAAADAYNAALQEALITSMDGSLSDEEYQAAIDNLISARAAVENAMIPLSEGYYFLVSGFDDFLNNFGVEKAAYIDPNVPNLKYRTFDAEDVDFVFYITPNGETDEFLVQSYASGYYVAKGISWYNSNPACTEDPEEPQNMRLYVPGKWYWGSRTYHITSYTPYASSQPKATDGQGNLTSWGQWKDVSTSQTHFNLWYVRRLTDEQMAAFAEKKAQTQRTAALKDLIGEASKLYDKLFVYEPDYSAKLITTVSGGADEEPGEGNQITFSTIRRQGVKFADKYEFLIDDDDTTYMQGSGYMSIKLKEPKQVITMVYNTRDASGHGSNKNWQVWGNQERPKLVSLYGANTEAGDTVYGGALATNIDMGSLPLPATYTFDFGRPVNRVAYQVTQNANGGSYFTLSEFQMYEAKANETTSQYFYVAGLKDKADAMNAMLPEMRDIVTANTATDEDITKLWAAITAVNELYSDTNDPTNLIEATEITIDKDSLSFNTIAPQTLVATISPDKALAIVKWSSCDENIATVDAAGKVTPVTNGKTMIIARTIDGTNISDTCFVTVDFKATGIVIDKPSLTFNNMEPQTISATIAPAKASQSVTWISSDDNIATVDENGVVTPINNGKAIIFATTTDGTNLKDICMVTVDFKAGNISLDKSEITLNYATSQSLTATITPDKANQSVVWSSSNPEIATVDELGNVTPVANGQAMISATTTDGTNLSSSCAVTVDFKATSMFIDKESIVLNYADAQSLMAAVIPASAQQTVAWSSSDETIVTVNENGELTPVGNGTAFVIATTTDGTELRDSCLVTVDLKATGVTIDKDSLTFNSFEPQTVVATISPAGAQAGVVWSSSDADIAIVDASGKVTPVNNGEAIIIATTTDGTELKDSCVVSVQIESQFESIATQTTISINALKDMSDIRVTIGEDSYASEDGSVKIEGLAPASTYRVNISAELDGGTWHEAFDVTTADITTEFECKTSPTTLNITGRYDAGDATVTNASFSSEEQLDEIAATGLEPGQTYTYTYYVTTEEGGTRSYEATFTTEALKLNTSQVKVVTVGDVVVSAESNITEEDNVKVGFEWRRTDWPDEIASKSGAAFIYNGAIEGYIRSLNTDKFWKIRTYFESGAGIKHYGDWITIDPSDASYFEPTVHTYAQAEVEGNTAYVKGYALNGSDKVTEQGFKYWEVLPSDLQPKYPQAVQVPAYAKSIAASGQLMTANISNLMYEMDYHYVAYVTTADGKTYYGEEQRIRIDDPVGIKDAVEESIAEGDVRTYTIDGRLVYAGAEKDMRLIAGLYIIRFADGTTKKVVIR